MFVSHEQYENIEQVQEQYPGAAHIEPVDGGWMVFNTATDYDIWAGQA